MNDEGTETNQSHRLLFINICAKYNIRFVDVEKIIKEQLESQDAKYHKEFTSEFDMRWTQAPQSFPSNYTPGLIVRAVKD